MIRRTWLRNLALTAHVVSSIGWLGAVAAFLPLAVIGLTSADTELVRGSYLSMDVIARLVISPLALSALATGLIQALGTTWGLFRHYWVIIKLVVTVFATAVLLQELGPIAALARAAGTLGPGDLRTARLSLVVHAAGGILVLLVPTVLSIYKPRGMTRYGQRKKLEQRRR